jgi:hypothetical protein
MTIVKTVIHERQVVVVKGGDNNYSWKVLSINKQGLQELSGHPTENRMIIKSS